jgi:hypothetical protein
MQVFCGSQHEADVEQVENRLSKWTREALLTAFLVPFPDSSWGKGMRILVSVWSSGRLAMMLPVATHLARLTGNLLIAFNLKPGPEWEQSRNEQGSSRRTGMHTGGTPHRIFRLGFVSVRPHERGGLRTGNRSRPSCSVVSFVWDQRAWRGVPLLSDFSAHDFTPTHNIILRAVTDQLYMAYRHISGFLAPPGWRRCILRKVL